MKKLLFGLLCLLLITVSFIPALPVQGDTTAGEVPEIIHQSTASPAVLARLQLPPYSICRGVALVGNYAYVTERTTKELFVFDVTNISPDSPAGDINPINSLNLSEGKYCIARKDNYLYLGGGQNIDIVDINTADLPVLIKVLNARSDTSIKVQNNYLLSIAGIGVASKIFDITSPADPVYLTSFGKDFNTDACIFKHRLYVGSLILKSQSGALNIYDLSDLNNLYELNSISLPFVPYHVEISGGRLLMAGEVWPDYGYINSYYLSDPVSPLQLSSIETTFLPRAFGLGQGFCIAAGIKDAHESEGVIVDTTSPHDLSISSTFSGSGTTVDGFPYEISISGDRFLVSGDRYATLFSLPETLPVQAPAVSNWAIGGTVVLFAGCIVLGLARRKPKSF